MADKAVGLGATDIWALGADFACQDTSGSTGDQSQDIVTVLDGDGDQAAQTGFENKTEFRASYKYTGTDLASDLAVKIGEIVESKFIDNISIKFETRAAVTVDISGHQHDTNPHVTGATGTFDGFDMILSTLIGSSVAGWGVPDDKPLVNSDTDSIVTSMTLNFILEHIDDDDGVAGAHWVGSTINGHVECDMEFLGEPTLVTTGWLQASKGPSEGNQKHDTFSYKFVYGTALAATVVPA